MVAPLIAAIAPAAISAVGSIASGAMDLFGAKESANASRANTAAQIKWEREKFEKEKELANTAHQREIADLEAAGMNKILTVNGGGAPVATMGSITPQMPDYSGYSRAGDRVAAAISTAYDIMIRKQELEKNINEANANINKSEAEARKANAEADSTIADMAPGGIKEQNIKESKKRQKVLDTEEALNRAKAASEKQLAIMYKRYGHESVVRAQKAIQETVGVMVDNQIKQMTFDNLPTSMTIETVGGIAKTLLTAVFSGYVLKGIFSKKALAGATKNVLTQIKRNPAKFLVDKSGAIIHEFN